MAKGQKYNDDIKERAIALLTVNNSVSYVARELGLPRSTVKSWKEAFDKEAEASGEDNIAKLRQKKKEDFIKDAWKLIDLSKGVLEKRLTRARDNEEALDELVDEICKLDYKTLTSQQRQALYMKLAKVKVEDVKSLATVLGTLYDKQALANKEATAIVEGSITIKKFEDF